MGSEPSQSTVQALSNATRKRSEAERRNLTERKAVKRLKSEMVTREKKKVAKKTPSGKKAQCWTYRANCEKKRKGLKQPKAKLSLKDQRKLAGKKAQCWTYRANCEKKRKGLKQPKAKLSLKDQRKLAKKASESISHKAVSKDSRQGSSHMLMENLPCRKLERQLKF